MQLLRAVEELRLVFSPSIAGPLGSSLPLVQVMSGI